MYRRTRTRCHTRQPTRFYSVKVITAHRCGQRRNAKGTTKLTGRVGYVCAIAMCETAVEIARLKKAKVIIIISGKYQLALLRIYSKLEVKLHYLSFVINI